MINKAPTKHNEMVVSNPWLELKRYTSARIALGRVGASITTNDWLDFRLAHAKARDAVHSEFNITKLETQLLSFGKAVVQVKSKVSSKNEYLKRPDLGRYLDAESVVSLRAAQQVSDLVIIISDGLSATAVQYHASNVLKYLLPMLEKANWTVAPFVIASFGRVALEDEVGALLGAKMALILIGERPGLSSADSLGAYFVYHPKSTNTDAERNCISNIRPAGLGYEAAAATIFHLLSEAKKRHLSGIKLKDNRLQLGGLLE